MHSTGANHMRLVRTLAAALAMAAVVALPAAAQAKQPKYYRYVAYIKGSQTTEWNQPYRSHPLNTCGWSEWAEGNGKETLTFKSVRPQRFLVQRNDQDRTIGFLYGVWNPNSNSAYGLHVTGSTTRNANAASGYDVGSCGNGSDYGSEEEYADCGTKARDWQAKLNPSPGPAAVYLSLTGTRNERFDDCGIYTPKDAFADSMSSFPVHLDIPKLVKSKKTIVINGSKTWEQPLDNSLRNPVEATTTATWQLRLKRVEK
jgi:hypothetical protein